MEALLAEWGTEILFGLISAAVMGYAKWHGDKLKKENSIITNIQDLSLTISNVDLLNKIKTLLCERSYHCCYYDKNYVCLSWKYMPKPYGRVYF